MLRLTQESAITNLKHKQRLIAQDRISKAVMHKHPGTNLENTQDVSIMKVH